GEHSKAIESLREVIRRSPDDALAHYALASVYRDDLHDPVGADREFREYLRVAPTGPHAAEAESSLLHAVPVVAPAPIEAAPVAEAPKRVDMPVAMPVAAPGASTKGAKAP
ncbi:MAG: hypothetical protein ACHREM_30895, partial [Polyangiales bacterium]